MNSSPKESLLRFQIGPVQDFIAAARSTRDLWSGSYLLSWLVAHGVRAAINCGVKVVFPATDGQPLLDFLNGKTPDAAKLCVPNFPNVFVLEIIADVTDNATGIAREVVQKVETAIRDEWKKIAAATLDFCLRNGLVFNETRHARFKHQVENFLSVAWQITLRTGDWKTDYERNARDLDAVRRTRNFAANDISGWNAHTGNASIKDSLTGTLEAVADSAAWEARASERESVKRRLKDRLALSAITLVKRFWDLAYLKDEKAKCRREKIANTHGIAQHKPFEDVAEDEPSDTESENKYFAVLKFDGDSVGQWISGEKTDAADEKFHNDFSAKLSEFALEKVAPIVAQNSGFLIYAGGDDVLALLPADTVLNCAVALRKAYRETLAEFRDKATGVTPDGSVGIAVAHVKAPLQDIVREAADAEKRKSKLARSAVGVTLIKRSGGITYWDNKWGFDAIELCDKLAAAMSADNASAKLPHRIIALLEPYLNAPAPLIKHAVSATGFTVVEVAKAEIAHALSRQVTDKAAREKLTALFDVYLEKLVAHNSDTDFILGKLIGLCTAAAFAKRTKKDTDDEK